jgi:thiol:disulfide interchange protein DsbG
LDRLVIVNHTGEIIVRLINTHACALLAVLFISSAQAVTQPGLSLWDALHHTATVTVGHGGRNIYEFFDPNCTYCRVAFAKEQPFIKKGLLTVHYVPLGFLTSTSTAKSAAILQAKNPASALRQDLMEMSPEGSGDIAPLLHPKSSTVAAIHHNATLLKRTGISIVPDLVFKDREGSVVIVRGIFPSTFLRHLAGAA